MSPARAATLSPADSGYVPVDGARLYYEQCGSGPDVVLLHDGLLHSVVWDRLWPMLSPGVHATRYDRRGYGRSDSVTARFSPTDDLRRLLARLGIRRAVLVGCSSGAGLAIDFALEHPDQVSELILVGPVLHGMATSAHFYQRGERNNEPLARNDFVGAARRWSDDPYEIAAGHDSARAELLAGLVSAPRNLRYPGGLEIRPDPPAVERLQAIRVPTLILVGEKDISDVQAYAGAIEAGIWGARREVVPGCAHLLPLEDAPHLARVIARLSHDFVPVAVPLDTLELWPGRYRSERDSLDVALRHGRLALLQPGERDAPLFPASSTRFFTLSGTLPRFEFLRDPRHRVTGVDVTTPSAVEHFARVGALGD